MGAMDGEGVGVGSGPVMGGEDCGAHLDVPQTSGSTQKARSGTNMPPARRTASNAGKKLPSSIGAGGSGLRISGHRGRV